MTGGREARGHDGGDEAADGYLADDRVAAADIEDYADRSKWCCGQHSDLRLLQCPAARCWLRKHEVSAAGRGQRRGTGGRRAQHAGKCRRRHGRVGVRVGGKVGNVLAEDAGERRVVAFERLQEVGDLRARVVCRVTGGRRRVVETGRKADDRRACRRCRRDRRGGALHARRAAAARRGCQALRAR